MNKDIKNTSKFLSLVLRHKPETIGIELDSNGWAQVEQLLAASGLTRETLDKVVHTSDKRRFSFSPDGTRIRANQGHSLQGVDLQLQPVVPPENLYHGTVDRFLDAIFKNGLQKMSRQHVHLSATVETALQVGARRGKPVVLIVDAGHMHEEGYPFFRSDNGVWLTEEVPARFFQLLGG